MKKIPKLFSELHNTLLSEEMFVHFLYAVLLYLASLLGFSLLHRRSPLVFVLPAVYLLYAAYREYREDTARIIEHTYPFLDERLRTLRDNPHEENPVVRELEEEVFDKIKYVRASTFFPIRRITVALSLVVVFSFLTVLVNVTAVKNPDLLKDSPYLSFLSTSPREAVSNISVFLNITDDIYGDQETLSLGDQELSIKLMPSSYDVSVREEGEFKEKPFDRTVATDISVESGEGYADRIPQDQQELVKNYFLELSKT